MFLPSLLRAAAPPPAQPNPPRPAPPKLTSPNLTPTQPDPPHLAHATPNLMPNPVKLRRRAAPIEPNAGSGACAQVKDIVLHRVKCARRANFAADGNDFCVVVGDSGRLFVTSSGFSPLPTGNTDAGIQTTYSRYAADALQNATTDLLTLGRMSWDNTGALEALLVGGTNGVILHLMPAELPNGDIDFGFRLQV